MVIKCVVSCVNASGEPDFCPVLVDCSQEQYEAGDHYLAASSHANDQRYERGVGIIYDENDGPHWLFQNFNWNAVATVQV